MTDINATSSDPGHGPAMDDALWKKYDRPVPRYTSYPTAPHFTGAVDEATYRGWLAALPADTPLSLYLHVPYCRTLCWYCGCSTRATTSHRPVANYAALLETEIATLASALERRRSITHLHWGGGTPTILREEEITRLMDGIARHFDIAADAELAIEIDPRTITPAYARTLAATGINRVSLGVQDFDPRVQQAINRVQPFEVTARAVDAFRAAGIDAVNFDLMYGLPHQSVEGAVRSAELAASLSPSRVALFGYAHVPWMRAHQRLIRDEDLPDARTRFLQAQGAGEKLVEQGYRRIGLDHFAHETDSLYRQTEDGSLSRNFQGYTTDTAPALIGLGASAIGELPQGFAQNTADVAAYGKAVREGHLPVTRGIARSDEDRLRWQVIERLMCTLEADLEAVLAEHGRAADHLDRCLPALAELEEDGLLERNGRRLRVTEAGRPFVRLAAAAFDEYLDRGAGRHSRAV